MNGIFSIIFLSLLSFQGFATDYSLFEENGKVGLKDNSGNIILPAAFDALGWSDGNFSVIGQITGYRQQNHWGLLNLKKEFVTKAIYESITSPGGDRVVVSKLIKPFTIKFGCIDLQGKEVIPFQFDGISLHDLRAIVMQKDGTRFLYGIVDLNGIGLVPVQYKKIEPLGSLRFVVQDFSGKSALCSEHGKWITGFTIDALSDFKFDLAVFHQDWKCGVIDRMGEIKIEPIYREIEISSPTQIRARLADEWRVINAKQENVVRLEADQILFDHLGWNRISISQRWGLLDSEFKLRLPVEYDYLSTVDNGMMVAKKDGKYRLIRPDQSDVLPLTFDSICLQNNFVRTLTRGIEKNSWALYDTFGIKKTEAPYEVMDDFNGKFFAVKNRGYRGAVDRYGKEIIACVYDSILETKDDLIAIRFKGQYGIITLRDEWRVPPQATPIRLLSADRYLEKKDSTLFMKDFQGNALYFTTNPITVFEDHLQEHLRDGTLKKINFQGQIVSRQRFIAGGQDQHSFIESEGLIGIRRDGKFGFVDPRGRLRIANRYDSISDFHEGLAAIKLLGKWGFINSSDQIVIQPQFQKASDFHHGMAWVRRDGKSGLIAIDGSILLELRYDQVSRFSEDLYIITLDGLYGLADARGRLLIEPRYNALEVLPSREVIVKQNNHYGLLSLEGMSLFPIQYNHLEYWPVRNEFFIHEKAEWREVVIR